MSKLERETDGMKRKGKHSCNTLLSSFKHDLLEFYLVRLKRRQDKNYSQDKIQKVIRRSRDVLIFTSRVLEE